MDKKNILERYRKENVDEGEVVINNMGNNYGFILMLIVSFFFISYNAIKGLPVLDIGCIVISFIVFAMYKKYKISKDKKYLSITILASFVFLINLFIFLITTW